MALPLVTAAPFDHCEAVLDEVGERLPQREVFRAHPILSGNEGQNLRAEGLAELTVLEKRGEDIIGIVTTAGFDDQPHSFVVALIADVADTLNAAVAHLGADALHDG